MILSQKERTEMSATIDDIERQAKMIEKGENQGTLRIRDIIILCRELKLRLWHSILL